MFLYSSKEKLLSPQPKDLLPIDTVLFSDERNLNSNKFFPTCCKAKKKIFNPQQPIYRLQTSTKNVFLTLVIDIYNY